MYRMEETKIFHNMLVAKEKALQENYDRLQLIKFQLTQESEEDQEEIED